MCAGHGGFEAVERRPTPSVSYSNRSSGSSIFFPKTKSYCAAPRCVHRRCSWWLPPTVPTRWTTRCCGLAALTAPSTWVVRRPPTVSRSCRQGALLVFALVCVYLWVGGKVGWAGAGVGRRAVDGSRDVVSACQRLPAPASASCCLQKSACVCLTGRGRCLHVRVVSMPRFAACMASSRAGARNVLPAHVLRPLGWTHQGLNFFSVLLLTAGPTAVLPHAGARAQQAD